ncbi:sensor histidine kinase [Glycomyces arizonensis]|uniref:sensor histidine kinase n=1 Tax=Glycomyces arizonensis TaxID=256035 RepID=UPI0003F8EAC0|nr:HAMP domain-containing sensor histidine kinase [Glycomyces arizonensis]
MTRSRFTLRARLTLVYGGLFLLAGLVLLGLTYWLVAEQLPENDQVFGKSFVSEGTPTSEEEPTVSHVETVVSDVWEEALSVLLAQGAIALAAVGALAVAIGWLLAGRMLAPLQRITDTAGRIAEAPAADRGLHERIRLDGPRDEVRELAETFNVMLERLDHSFDGQRRFIANASHELRTPLTLTRALLEVALHRPNASPEVRQLGETLLEVNARHERLIDGLLLLMRSDRELTERAYVDLADLAEHVAAQTDAAGRELTVEAGEAPTTGDPVLLERLVHNLVENAVRYNAEGGWVKVWTGVRGDRSVLEVSNTGPVVAAYETAALFEPFRRLGGERLATTPGTGLGLSIVRAVARAHGGEADAVPREGGGLTVTVALPLSSA